MGGQLQRQSTQERKSQPRAGWPVILTANRARRSGLLTKIRDRAKSTGSRGKQQRRTSHKEISL